MTIVGCVSIEIVAINFRRFWNEDVAGVRGDDIGVGAVRQDPYICIDPNLSGRIVTMNLLDSRCRRLAQRDRYSFDAR